jgi:hypothetical protein
MSPRSLLTTFWRWPVLLLMLFLAAAAQAPISDVKSSISIAGFTFRITAVAFDRTAMGFVPPDMKDAEQVMFVEFELLAGDEEDFKDLAIQVSSESGRRYKPVLLTAGGAVKMLATVTMKDRTGQYQPQKGHIAWIYVIPRSAGGFRVHFPTGESIDLALLIQK